jgi:hypothetical protein
MKTGDRQDVIMTAAEIRRGEAKEDWDRQRDNAGTGRAV